MTEEGAASEFPASVMTALEATPWWIVLLGGIVALVFGVVLVIWPETTLMLLVTLVGLYWLAAGVLAIIGAFSARGGRGWKVISGFLGILAGIVVLAYPFYSAILLPTLLALFVGIWGVVIGLITLYQAFRGAGWGTGILGIVSIVIGLLILAHPLISAAVLILLVAIVAIIGGFAAIGLSFRSR
jgi:uncharacterized membrane protein HdeD (DUF308 family)